MIAFRVTDLTVSYGPVVAVRELSFSVESGEALVLLGPNGAGKTSAVEAIAGLLPKRRGTVELFGMDISRHRPKTFEELDNANFDLIVTLSPEAHHRALEFARDLQAEVVYWPTPDPTATQGSRETILDAYRETRDRLAGRIKSYLHRPWESPG